MRKLASLCTFPTVASLPEAASYTNSIVSYGGVLHWSNGITWISLDTTTSNEVLQSFRSNMTAMTGTAVKSDTNTTPVATDGTQVWTRTITPILATSNIILEGSVFVDHATNGRRVYLAAFRGTTFVGIAARYIAAAAKGDTLSFKFKDTPNSVAALTYTIRAWAHASGSWYVAQSVTPYFNTGLAASSVVELKEMAV